MIRKLMLATAILTVGLVAMASADTLLIQEIASEGADHAGWPARGLTMSQVEAEFGNPETRLPPVGDPPITRWEYGEFVVFFEGDIVLHSVRRRAKH
jgi:hypothetical protein